MPLFHFANKFRAPCAPRIRDVADSDAGGAVLGVIAQIESGMKPGAVKFDRRLFGVFIAELQETGNARADWRFARHCNSCDLDTALMLCASRFGLFQLSGSQLYGPDLRLDAPIAAFLANAALQGEAVRRLLAAKGVDYTPAALAATAGRERFAAAFRGSISYADHLRRSLEAFGVLPTDAPPPAIVANVTPLRPEERP